MPDLILLDMLLPKLSGPDVLIALKKDPLTEADSGRDYFGHLAKKRCPAAKRWCPRLSGKIRPRPGGRFREASGGGRGDSAELPEAAPAPTEWEIYGAVEIESSASASAVSASVHGNK
jgi:hypothetical protein